MPSLLRLLRTSLRPYAGYVVLVVSLLLIQSIANLYLPNLNADIINNGVVKGDVGYIWRIGAIMLVLAVFVGILSIVAVWFASRRRWDSAGTSGVASSSESSSFRPPR